MFRMLTGFRGQPEALNNFGPVSSLEVLHMRPETTGEQRFARPVDDGVRSLPSDAVADAAQDPGSDILIHPHAENSAEDTAHVAVQPTRPIQLLEPFTSLAKWAFGPEGPPLLKFVTCGDFAHYGNGDKECFMLSREPEGDDEFRFIAPGSREWKEVLWYYGDLLESCPDQPLYKWPHHPP